MPQPPPPQPHPIIPNPLSHHHTPGSKVAREEDIKAYGFSALPRSTAALLASRVDSKQPTELSVVDIPLPDSPLVTKVIEYGRKELPVETFNHSMRVFYYGIAIAKFSFPDLLTPSWIATYLLTSLLHDIGTTPMNITSTLLSFEFHGGLLVLDLLKKEGAPTAQAESVAEAVIRHQDLGETGWVTSVTALVLLATIFDNIGKNAELVHPQTIMNVTNAYPRLKWSQCFAHTIGQEMELKPWAHSSHLGEKEFREGVLGNTLMEPYE
ncbi:hypothetical protein VC83_02667 [Pseudogymnoascus destructans]|uniref:HD domain-containing protein n=2 Tax=Pseudogymnoascus destructans TaxID=655981 RepID=L8FPR8_PSED2|nr:uncharacterized protein VC83_02667 [Pseudogymnoascus destructans]ELR02912.1 hypothetical protein GMDG_01133 [Pseudogymnoascus destructans 20631-21]OAF60767.1 hypothetical protein VC83_02667 [Pseudogymnoascus destructans]